MASELKLPKFRPIVTWYSSKQFEGNNGGNDDIKGRVVLKANNGARGIGQIFVDTDITPLAGVLTQLRRIINKKDNEGKSLPISDITKAFPDVVYKTDGENHSNEGDEHFRNFDFFIQEYVPNIKAEYRLLRSLDGSIYVAKRDIAESNDSYKQATVKVDSTYVNNGYPETIDNCKELEFIGTDLASTRYILNSLFDRLTFGFGSVDLFVTQDNQWGILEHCNQFATEDYHPSFMVDFHKTQIDVLLEKAGVFSDNAKNSCD
jgi:hypothetical protein